MTRKRYIRMILAGGEVQRNEATSMAWAVQRAGIDYQTAACCGLYAPARLWLFLDYLEIYGAPRSVQLFKQSTLAEAYARPGVEIHHIGIAAAKACEGLVAMAKDAHRALHQLNVQGRIVTTGGLDITNTIQSDGNEGQLNDWRKCAYAEWTNHWTV